MESIGIDGLCLKKNPFTTDTYHYQIPKKYHSMYKIHMDWWSIPIISKKKGAKPEGGAWVSAICGQQRRQPSGVFIFSVPRRPWRSAVRSFYGMSFNPTKKHKNTWRIIPRIITGQWLGLVHPLLNRITQSLGDSRSPGFFFVGWSSKVRLWWSSLFGRSWHSDPLFWDFGLSFLRGRGIQWHP